MSELLALSVSVAILGGIWAFIALGPLAGYALVWVGFIAAACFFAAGADTKALSKTIVGMIYGAIVGWITLLIIKDVSVPCRARYGQQSSSAYSSSFLSSSHRSICSPAVPANIYGYAAIVGYTLSAGKLDAVTATNDSNPLFLLIVSTILGGILGYLIGQLANVLKAKKA